MQPAQVSLAWLLARPAVVAPIVGTTGEEQLEAAVAAVDLTLSAEECATLEALYQPFPVLGWMDGAVVLTPPR